MGDSMYADDYSPGSSGERDGVIRRALHWLVSGPHHLASRTREELLSRALSPRAAVAYCEAERDAEEQHRAAERDAADSCKSLCERGAHHVRRLAAERRGRLESKIVTDAVRRMSATDAE